jgi:CRP/FNR family transcriptional regulator, dissimilatory nitrate respiration regulator
MREGGSALDGEAITTPPATDEQAFADSVLGQGLNPGDLAEVLTRGYARLAKWPLGAVLARRAEPQREFFVVLSGRLQVVRTRSDGSRHIIDVVNAGGACGAVTAFAPKPRWPADVHAARPVRVLVVDTRGLMASSAPEAMRQTLLQNCVRLLADRARHLNARGELLTRRGLRARLAFYLIRQADPSGRVAPSLTRQELADHLQVSRASMTRELGRMAEEGLLVIDGRAFQLHNLEALKSVAR